MKSRNYVNIIWNSYLKKIEETLNQQGIWKFQTHQTHEKKTDPKLPKKVLPSLLQQFLELPSLWKNWGMREWPPPLLTIWNEGMCRMGLTGWPLVGNMGMKPYIAMMGIHSLIPETKGQPDKHQKSPRHILRYVLSCHVLDQRCSSTKA